MTPKQEAFAIAVVGGNNQADAYRIAYDAKNMKATTIASKASILMTDGNVRAMIDNLKQQLADKELWTREDSIRAMIQVIEEPDNQGCKINAVKVINDMQGFNAATKTQVSGTITHENALDMLR
jgi:hypothetical protein